MSDAKLKSDFPLRPGMSGKVVQLWRCGSIRSSSSQVGRERDRCKHQVSMLCSCSLRLLASLSPLLLFSFSCFDFFELIIAEIQPGSSPDHPPHYRLPPTPRTIIGLILSDVKIDHSLSCFPLHTSTLLCTSYKRNSGRLTPRLQLYPDTVLARNHTIVFRDCPQLLSRASHCSHSSNTYSNTEAYFSSASILPRAKGQYHDP
jgi:hypothetical protein